MLEQVISVMISAVTYQPTQVEKLVNTTGFVKRCLIHALIQFFSFTETDVTQLVVELATPKFGEKTFEFLSLN